MAEPASSPPIYAPRGYATGTAADDQPALAAVGGLSLYPSLDSATDGEEEEEGPRLVEASAAPVLYRPRGHAALPNSDAEPAISAANYPSLLPSILPSEAEPASVTPPNEVEPASVRLNEAEPTSPFQYAPRGHAAVGEPSASDAATINTDNYPSLLPTEVDEPPNEAPAQAPTVEIATTTLTTRRHILGSQFARWLSRFKRRR